MEINPNDYKPNDKVIPEAFKTFLKDVPLRAKLRSVLKQNDLQNWSNGEYKGDLDRLENTVLALEAIVLDHFEPKP